MLKSLAALSAGLIAGADAFWRMECPGRIALGRIDPIVNPGALSSHVHTIHGSNGFSDTSNTSDLQKGTCTSCRVTQDKSAYWHPALYFKDHTTGNFHNVPQSGGMLAYYLLYGQNIKAFPPGFRMISGSNDRRDYTLGDPSQPDPPKSDWAARGETSQEALAQRAVGFNCLDYGSKPEGALERHALPDKSFIDRCKNGVRFEIMFPSCWKGGNVLDSPNHKDHVAFPSLLADGTCPEGFPVRLPTLFYEVIWNTAAFRDANGTFVLSNGDTTGFGYHADFLTGWDQDFLQRAVDRCRNDSGRIQDCPVFDVTDEDTAKKCKVPEGLVKEKVEGPLEKLPGNNEVSYRGGLTADGKPPAPLPAAPMSRLPYAPPASPPSGQILKETTAPSPKKQQAPPPKEQPPPPRKKQPAPPVGNTAPSPKEQPAPPVGKTNSSSPEVPAPPAPPVELADTSPKKMLAPLAEKTASPQSAATTKSARVLVASAVGIATSSGPVTPSPPPQASSPPASNIEISYSTTTGTDGMVTVYKIEMTTIYEEFTTTIMPDKPTAGLRRRAAYLHGHGQRKRLH